MRVFPDTHHSTSYRLCKTTLITCRGKITTILLRKTQESFREVYRIARNVGGVKLWRINEILYWRRKLWRITYFGDHDQVEMSGGRREMLAA